MVNIFSWTCLIKDSNFFPESKMFANELTTALQVIFSSILTYHTYAYKILSQLVEW